MSLRVMCLLGLIAGISGNAQALTCYEIVDSGDNTLYRATIPPFALNGSDWNSAQDRLRKEGRHLLWFDTNNCPESIPSPAYASTKAAENPADLLQARAGRSAVGIYTRDSGSGPSAVGTRAPVVVVPAGGAGAAGYSR